MPGGILIFGANGGGKSTIGRELARLLRFNYLDIEEYAFLPSEIPYAAARSKEECVRLLRLDMEKGPFVFSSVKGDYGEEIVEKYELAAWVSAPAELRLERVKQRACAQHGERISPGGDMYRQHLKFMDFVASRPLAEIERWAATLRCPVLPVDGTRPISENAEWLAGQCAAVFRLSL